MEYKEKESLVYEMNRRGERIKELEIEVSALREYKAKYLNAKVEMLERINFILLMFLEASALLRREK